MTDKWIVKDPLWVRFKESFTYMWCVLTHHKPIKKFGGDMLCGRCNTWIGRWRA